MNTELHRVPVNVSLAAFAGMPHTHAVHLACSAAADAQLVEPLFGPLRVDHVQLVPQSSGVVTIDLAQQLTRDHPATRFRLHANVRVLKGFQVANLATLPQHLAWFRQAGQVSRALAAPAYTAHAGRRCDASLAQVLDHTRRAADLFGCPVGVEGHYPDPAGQFLVSSWPEYRLVFESGVPYCLDLSHLNILARQSGGLNPVLLQEMLACERCLEVHVSDNDGRSDQHRVCREPTWWAPLLPYIHAGAVVFSEGNHRRAQLGVEVRP